MNHDLLADIYALKPQNVVVLHVDTLRADHLPFYGYARDTLPNLSRRSGWVVQERHYATSSWTFPSTTSFLTSTDLYEHGIVDIRLYDGEPLAPLTPSYASYLGDHGIHTGFFNGNGDLDHTTLVEGWEVEQTDPTPLGSALALSAAALSWAATIPTDEPFFLMLQPMDPHGPIQVMDEDLGTWVDVSKLPFSLEMSDAEQDAVIQATMSRGDPAELEALKTGLQDLYDEELLALDRGIEALLVGLEEQGRLEDTLVILTADHGESLLDTPEAYGHGGSLREELVRIPLVFYNPSFSNDWVDTCLTNNMQVLPTVATLLGVDTMPAPARPSLFFCSSNAFSSLYKSTDQVPWLDRVGVDGKSQKIDLDCVSSKVDAFDLVSDPGALNPINVESTDLALQSRLLWYADKIEQASPAFSCQTQATD